MLPDDTVQGARRSQVCDMGSPKPGNKSRQRGEDEAGPMRMRKFAPDPKVADGVDDDDAERKNGSR